MESHDLYSPNALMRVIEFRQDKLQIRSGAGALRHLIGIKYLVRPNLEARTLALRHPGANSNKQHPGRAGEG